MDDLPAQLERRRRVMQHRAAGMTSEQNLEQMKRAQRAWLNMMTPKGFEHFVSRNFRKRAVRRDDLPPDSD